MLAADIALGHRYALRAASSDREPLTEAQVVSSPRSGKVRVRYLDGPLEGLDEWVPTRLLMCSWAERKAFLRDEQSYAVLTAASDAMRESAEEWAISTVMEATGEHGGFQRTWTATPHQAERMWQRAQLDGQPQDQPLSYIDRHGQLHLTYATALTFAKAFAAAQPDPCLLLIRREREQMTAQGFEPGNRITHELLRQFDVPFAIVESWASRPVAALLEDENQRLRGLVAGAASTIERLGDTTAASRLRRAIKGG